MRMCHSKGGVLPSISLFKGSYEPKHIDKVFSFHLLLEEAGYPASFLLLATGAGIALRGRIGSYPFPRGAIWRNHRRIL